MVSLLQTTHKIDLLSSIRNQLEAFEIKHLRVAKLLCALIPARCPFERDIKVFDYTLMRIPPLCKLNPFYDQLVGLRYKSLVFLEEKCPEDIMRYC